jgi:hypothetical protein
MKHLASILIASTLLAFLGCSKATRYPAGSENGQCYPNKTCNDGLTCNLDSLICVTGSLGSGGAGRGGATGSGGQTETGGSGGSDETGGTSGSGGDHGSGGASGNGGSTSSGGAQGDSGGATSSGGSAGGSGGGAGGSTSACGPAPSSNTVTFCNGLALGAMTGWGWVSLGSADAITDPTCNTAKATITSATRCEENTNWNKTDALCMTGSVPALAATDPDYTGNWGVQVGVNAKDPNAGIGSSWKTITFSVTGSPTTGLRAVIHKNGDPEDVGYCSEMTPGTPLNITDLKTNCWDSTGTALSESDAGSIDQVGVQVTSTAAAITVDNLCLTKVEFGN